MRKLFLAGAVAGALALSAAATERLFTYTYEPETLPQRAMEFEQWVTLRAGRNTAVGQDHYRRWQFREELEYGVTDFYSLSLYLNTRHEAFRDSAAGTRTDRFRFDGVSLENILMVLNPAEHPVGVSLYLEPTYDGENFELEQKIILGQRHGEWKWALNLTHAAEWSRHFREVGGEVEFSLGVARNLSKHWALGLEARDHNELPGYRTWENTAVYVGPVLRYLHEKWWAALTVMPQVFGANFSGDPDRSHHLELEGHERWNVRLIFGLDL